MADKGLRNPLHQAADDIQNQEYQLPSIERPETQGLAGSSSRPGRSGDYDFSSADGLLPPPELEPLFMSTAQRHGVPVNVLMALAQQESSYRPDAIGIPTKWGRAKGMMQYIDPTAETMGINPLDPEQAIDAAARQLKQRLDQGYTMTEAVMAHHGGDDRNQWGPKTQRYGHEVLGKAGAIYQQAAPREEAPPENPRAFGESGIPYKPKPELPDQGGPVDGMTGAAPKAERPQQGGLSGGQQERPLGAGERLRQGMREEQAGIEEAPPEVDGMTGADRKFDPMELAARQEAARRGKATVLTDFANLLQIGADRGVLSFREGVKNVFGDKLVEQIDRVDEWMNKESTEEMFERQIETNEGQLSQEMFDARRKDWITEGDDGYGLGPAWGDWRSYAAGMVESLPETAVTMAPGAILAKGVYANGLARGLSAAQAGRRAATTATVAGSLSEGFLGGGASAREVRTAIEGMSEEQLADSDVMRTMQANGMSFEEARAKLAESSSAKAFILAGTITGAFGGQGDRLLAKLLTQKGGGNRLTSALRGALTEGLLEEAPQEAGQQIAENVSMQDADPNVETFGNVPNAAAGGAVAGAGLGAGMGAAFGGKRNTPADILAQELNRNIDAASAQGMEGEALHSMEPTPLDDAPKKGPDANPDPLVYENADYSREQWEADWAEFDRNNPEVTINGMVSDTGQPAPAGGIESAIQEAGREERVQAVQGERVVVRTRTGEISGTIQRYREDGEGGYEARILGDDGTPYVFNDGDEVKIVREEAKEAAPKPATSASVPTQMTNDMRRQLEGLGYDNAAIRKLRPQEAWDIIQAGQAAPSGPVGDAGGAGDPGVAATEAEPEDREAQEPPKSTRVQDLSDGELDAQRQYVAKQAQVSGWTTPLNKRRKEIKAELKRREEAAGVEVNPQDTTPVVDSETPKTSDNANPSAAEQAGAEAAIAASSAVGRHLGINKAKQSPKAAREITYKAKVDAYSRHASPEQRQDMEKALSGTNLDQPFPALVVDDRPRFGASGGYNLDDNTVHLSSNPTEWTAEDGDTAVTPARTVHHEVGHWGFMSVLNGKQRLAATEAIQGDLRKELIPGKEGSDYPKGKFDDIDEYVAEMYSNWKRGLPTDERLLDTFAEITREIGVKERAAIEQAITEGEKVRAQRKPKEAPPAGEPTGEPIVEHVTQRGKTLRGVVRDVSQADAKAIDPYTFKKDGGWFIREKRLAAAGETASVTPDVPRESLLFTDKGKPFKSYEQAARKITNRGLAGKPVQVDDGWGIQLDAAVDVQRARHETDTTPSEGQAEAGNYKKGRVSLNGFEIAIENPKGSTRSGTDPDGNRWESTMAHDYGDIKGTTAADGDNLDVFLGDDLNDAAPVYVVDQLNDDGSFDEHKIMMGFRNKTEARQGYLDNYEEGWQGLGDISELDADAFKAWVKSGDLSKPLSSNAVKAETKAEPETPAEPEDRAESRRAIGGAEEGQSIRLRNVGTVGDGRVYEVKKIHDNGRVDVISDQGQEIHMSTAGLRGAAKKTRDGVIADVVEAEQPTAGQGESIPAKGPLPVPPKAFKEVYSEALADDDPRSPFVTIPTARAAKRAKQAGHITLEEAKARREEWKAHAKAQGESGVNNGRVVLSLFDVSGEWSKPWRDAGYEVHQFDLQRGEDISQFDVEYLTETLGLPANIDAILMAPPCTDFSVAVNREWAERDADGRTEASVELLRQGLRTVELFRPTVWALENPGTGRTAKATGMPDPALRFQPHHYGDPYTKLTALWGDFQTDLPQANVDPVEGSKIAKLGGKDKYGRSLTPEGFAYAFFMANNLADMAPVERLGRQFRGVDRELIQGALDAGQAEEAIQRAIEDDWNDGAVEAANDTLRGMTEKTEQPAGEVTGEVTGEVDDGRIGVNREGKPLYAARDGVRYYYDRNVKLEEPVETPPSGAARIQIEKRPGSDFETAEERAAREQRQAPEEKPKAGENTVFTEDAAEKARALLKAKLGQLNSGIDPEMMQAGITLAGYHIEKGARTFAAYARAMTGDLGEAVKPYLKSWYMGVKYDPRAAGFDGMDDAATVESADVDAITSEEPSDERQTDAAGREADQGRGGRDTGQREPGEDAQPGTASADRDGVEDVPPGDVAGAATPGDRSGLRDRSATADVGGDRPAGGERDATQRGGTDRRKGASDAGAGRDGGRTAPPRDPDSVSPANPGPTNWHYENPLEVVGGGQVARFKKNQAAIETYLAIRDEDREATREEQEILAGYTGWGSFGQELFQGTWERPMPKSGWEARDQWLRDHLGKTEWEGMQRSIINAHYTDPPTTMAMWSMMERMGFKGGRVLEPSMGIGNFFGMMPAKLANRSQLTGIELDPLTGGMAQKLYPESNIRVMGYQDSKTPDDYYDAVIGNWPFENSPLADRRYNKLNPFVHDYFFLKALDQVRPGGIVMAITSAGSMDKKDARIRRELAKKGELVAAYRLPSGAFQEYAGTKVVTDIIILRKRPERLENVSGEEWIQSAPMKTKGGTDVSVNEYYHAHPENVIGEIDFGHGTTSGRPGMIVHRPSDMQAQLDRIVAEVPEGAYRETTREDRINYVTNHTADREGSLTRTDDGLFVVRGEQLAPADEVVKYKVKSAKTTAEREAQLDALIGMRQQYARLIEAEREVAGQPEAERKALKKAYDAFVKANGSLNSAWGIQYLRKIKDPFATSLRALERKEKGKWVPATILERSTIRTPKRIDNPSIEEAYVLSRNGAVNPSLEEIAERANTTPEKVRETLLESGAIFNTPGGDIIPSDMYLSGNVRQKLRDAEAALAEGDEAMQRNVDALKEALPADIPYFNIEVQMGASWVPTGVYEQFVAHMLDLPDTNGVHVRYDMGRWKVKLAKTAAQRREASTGFGTKAYPFTKLVNAAISNQTVTIKKTIEVEGSKQEVLDREATDETNNKIAEMREKFGEWLWSDPERRDAMETEYNEVRNSYASPKYDGSFLRFEGMALEIGDSPFNLREHQANAIWRGLVTRKSLNAHEVGTGKSFTLAGIAVESRRYGIAKKPLIFAHNANSASVAGDINVMYPAAKVLYLDNLTPKEIDTRLRQIANDDWDAVVVPHSLIDRFSFKEDTLMAMAQEDIEALEREAMEAAKEEGVELKPEVFEDADALKKLRSTTAKELVKSRNRIIESIKKQAQRASRENAVTFEDLGVDMVLVDEVHEFKKPPITTKMRVKGLQTDTSQRSLQLRFITDYIRANNGGANVHTFTGTPITNTLTEIFHQMRYIMKEDMEATGVDQWDGWFGSFAKEVQDVELNGAGDWETVNRLRGFINVPELRKLVGLYMDVVFSDDMPEMQPRKTASGKTLDDPSLTERERGELLNGRTEGAADRPYKQVVTDTADLTEDQKAIFRMAQERSQAWKNMGGKARKEAMQNGRPEVPIQVEGLVAKASFDARLARDEELAGMEGQVPDEPDSKLSRAIAKIVELYNSDPNANQVVFSDSGVSKTATRSVRDEGGNIVRDEDGKPKKRTVKVFSSMHDMLERLVQAGIPREQIAFVDGSTPKPKRKEIAEAMNRSEIRVVIGSTGVLGVGVNMQRNLRAMHHMDAPYMPGDLEQRNGRGKRQGNQWNTVQEHRYITDRLDGRRWQILSIKQQFIEDFLKADGSQRVIEGDAAEEEQSDILETFAEAAGDPRILIRTKLESQLEQLRKRQRLHGQGIKDAKRSERETREQIDRSQSTLDRWARDGVVEAAKAAIKANAGKAFSMEVNGTTYTDRKAADEALNGFANQTMVKPKNRTEEERIAIGEYAGLPLHITWGTFSSAPNLLIEVNGETLETGNDSVASLEATLRNFPSHRDNLAERVKDAERSAERLAEVQQQPFAHGDKLASVERQLDALEEDLANNPVPPPAWLRQGAPIDTEVKWRGTDYTVTGHRWNENGWFVLSQNAKGQEVELPYREVKDDQGMPLYEEREFEAPALASDIPMDILRTHKPGMRIITPDPTTGEEVAVEVTRAPFREGGKDSPVQVMAKFPDGQTRQITVAPGSQDVSKTLADADGGQSTAELAERLRGNRLARRMLDQGRLQLHASVAATGRNLPGSTAGFVDRNGKVHLIAGNIVPGNETAALMHEVFHNATQPLAGSAEWSRLMGDLRSLRSRSRRARGKFREVYREATARVEAAKAAGDTMTPQRELEEFGAYAIEQYERMPKTLRTWVDNAMGTVKAWMRDKLGIQLGQLTPPQLRAMALAGMRSRRGDTAPTSPETPLSVADSASPQQRKAVLDEAIGALDGKSDTPPVVGRVIGDMSRIAKFFAHPRTVASLHKSFQPVYQTGINQFEMRDAIIDDLWQNYRAYGRLSHAKKGNVNKVLELGRLMGATYSPDDLRAGVTKPTTHAVARFDDQGKPYVDHEPLHAELMRDEETVKLDAAEIDAYLALREMFDTALDMFRDQTLDDYKLGEFKGLKNSAGAILDSIDDDMSAAEAERRQNIARFINEIEQAKRTGYVPFSRYGDYVIAVKERQAELGLVKASDPKGDWFVTGTLPEKLEAFLTEIGATYDNLEGGWRVDRAQKQALEKENERTVYSTKVETGARDLWQRHKATKAMNREDYDGAKLDNIPAVRGAIAKTQAEWVAGNPLRQVVAFPTAKVSGGNPVSLSDLDALAEISSIDNATWDAVREQLADTIKGLSFRKHFFQAQNVPGYSGDFERSITDYMGGMGGYLSRRHHQKQWDNAIERIKGQRLREYAEKYRAYTNSPQEEYAMLRQVGFLSYIAGNIATAFVNTTQVPVMTMPALSMVAGHARAAKEVTRAYKDALKMYGLPNKTGLQMFDPKKAPEDVRDALEEAWGKGAFVPLETFEVMAASRIRHAGQRRARRGFENLVQGTAYVFTAAERLNRLVTFIASARLAKNPKVRAKANRVLAGNYHARQTVLKNWSPESFAEYIIDETQYRMGKANRPTVMRNVGAPIMQFKSFMFQTLETWYRWSSMQGKEGKMSAAASIAMMVGLGGLWGFPGAEDARDLVELLWRKLTKEDIDLESELRVWLYDTTGQRWLAEGITKGAPYPTGLDMSRVGMGQIMPQGVDGVFGIPYDMFVGRPSRAMTDITNENYPAAAGEFVPNAVRNVIDAAQWSLDGAYDSKGRKLLDKDQISTTAKFQRAIGFQPSVVSEVRDYEWAQYRDESRIYQLKRLYTDRLGRRIADMVRAEQAGKVEQVREMEQEITGIYAEIEEHNMNAAPEDIIEIGNRAINNRVAREMGGVITTWGSEGRRAARGSAAHLREVYGLDEILNEED